MMSAPDVPPMESYVVYTDEAIASAADGGYGIAFLPRGTIEVCIVRSSASKPGPDFRP